MISGVHCMQWNLACADKTKDRYNPCLSGMNRIDGMCIMAERVGFEPTHASRRLVDFESTPLGLLGTFPLLRQQSESYHSQKHSATCSKNCTIMQHLNFKHQINRLI
jgi:hypothetical protein